MLAQEGFSRSCTITCVLNWEVIDIFVCRPEKLSIFFAILCVGLGSYCLIPVPKYIWFLVLYRLGECWKSSPRRSFSVGRQVWTLPGKDCESWIQCWKGSQRLMPLPRSGTEILSYDHKPSWELLGILAANHGHFPNLEENGSHNFSRDAVHVFQYYESYSSTIVTYHPVHRSCLERKSVVRGFGATCFNETKTLYWICNRGPPPTQSMLLLSLSQMTSLSRTPWNSIFPVFCLESRSKNASSILVFPSKLQRQQNTTDRNVICHGAEKHFWHRIAINSTKISNYFDTNN